MDTGNYIFDTLRGIYRDFRAPAFEVTLGSLKITSNQFPICDLQVEIASDGSAGGCSFTIGAVYDYEKSSFADKVINALKVGTALTVKGGYIKKKDLFYGYVDKYDIDFSESSPPKISITGIDGMGFLMSRGSKAYGSKKSVKDLVTEMLNSCRSAKFIKSVTIEPTIFESKVEDVKENISDHAYLKGIAEQRFLDFLIINGEAIFKDLTSNTTSLIELSLGKGLISFRKSVSLDEQVGAVTVNGLDTNNEKVTAKVTSTTLKGSGKTAIQQAPAFADSEKELDNLLVTTQEECQKAAQAIFNRYAINYVHGEGRCIGLPEIIPGRYITISNLNKTNKEVYYISKVTHSFSSDGYFTDFEVKGAKC